MICGVNVFTGPVDEIATVTALQGARQGAKQALRTSVKTSLRRAFWGPTKDELRFIAEHQAQQTARLSVKEGIRLSLRRLPAETLIGGGVYLGVDEASSYIINGHPLSWDEGIKSFKEGALVAAGLRLGVTGAASAMRASTKLSWVADKVNKFSNKAANYRTKPFFSRAFAGKVFYQVGENTGKNIIRFGLDSPYLMPLNLKTITGFTAVGPFFFAADVIWDTIKNGGELSWSGKEEGITIKEAFALQTIGFAKMGVWLPTFMGILGLPASLSHSERVYLFSEQRGIAGLVYSLAGRRVPSWLGSEKFLHNYIDSPFFIAFFLRGTGEAATSFYYLILPDSFLKDFNKNGEIDDWERRVTAELWGHETAFYLLIFLPHPDPVGMREVYLNKAYGEKVKNENEVIRYTPQGFGVYSTNPGEKIGDVIPVPRQQEGFSPDREIPVDYIVIVNKASDRVNSGDNNGNGNSNPIAILIPAEKVNPFLVANNNGEEGNGEKRGIFKGLLRRRAPPENNVESKLYELEEIPSQELNPSLNSEGKLYKVKNGNDNNQYLFLLHDNGRVVPFGIRNNGKGEVEIGVNRELLDFQVNYYCGYRELKEADISRLVGEIRENENNPGRSLAAEELLVAKLEDSQLINAYFEEKAKIRNEEIQVTSYLIEREISSRVKDKDFAQELINKAVEYFNNNYNKKETGEKEKWEILEKVIWAFNRVNREDISQYNEIYEEVVKEYGKLLENNLKSNGWTEKEVSTAKEIAKFLLEGGILLLPEFFTKHKEVIEKYEELLPSQEREKLRKALEDEHIVYEVKRKRGKLKVKFKPSSNCPQELKGAIKSLNNNIIGKTINEYLPRYKKLIRESGEKFDKDQAKRQIKIILDSLLHPRYVPPTKGEQGKSAFIIPVIRNILLKMGISSIALGDKPSDVRNQFNAHLELLGFSEKKIENAGRRLNEQGRCVVEKDGIRIVRIELKDEMEALPEWIKKVIEVIQKAPSIIYIDAKTAESIKTHTY
ncbi:MAG: hypothetical protein DRP81_04970, partial [Candidatus Omnitrophota bacterium]